ncbi:MAG: hypothetical protein KatS3mg129_2330 [Leptospiraceae bacterium]|nr:MAG: hypothetical protein KatS3mg129_2330 [Leptospiraceae bacterium]
MKVLRIIILLMIVINCYDPEMTKKQCKEQFKSAITKFLIIRGDYETYKKRRESQGETEEEIQKSWNDGITYIYYYF